MTKWLRRIWPVIKWFIIGIKTTINMVEIIDKAIGSNTCFFPGIEGDGRFKVEILGGGFPSVASCFFEHSTVRNFIGKRGAFDVELDEIVAKGGDGIAWFFFLFGIDDVGGCDIDVKVGANGIFEVIITNIGIV